MKISLWDIYKKFVKVGAILIGGGYVILPILKNEIVEKNSWITEDELIDFYAVSQSLPGIIAANISIFVGYKLRSILGALSAILGIITTPFITILLLFSLITKISSSCYFKNILWGVGFGVIFLIISSIKEMWTKSIVDTFTFFLFLIMLFLILEFDISPVWIVLSSIFIGLLYKKFIRKENNK